MIDVAFTDHRQDTTKGIHFDLRVFESALEIAGPSLTLRNVVGTLELTFDAVCTCGPGLGAFGFPILTARAGISHLEGGNPALGHFSLAFSGVLAAVSFLSGFVVVPDAFETVFAAASTRALAGASRFFTSAPQTSDFGFRRIRLRCGPVNHHCRWLFGSRSVDVFGSDVFV